MLAEHKISQYFGYLAWAGGLQFGLERTHYRRQRRHDGIFILQTNDAGSALARSWAPTGSGRKSSAPSGSSSR